MSVSAFARYPSLKGKVVFITGGATGIGADFVRGFAAQGALVALTSATNTQPRHLFFFFVM
jgi:D-xylose 1-dehydrogenase